MSNFHNMIPELIIRSELNRILLNNVNDAFYKNQTNLKSEKDAHEQRVRGRYQQYSISAPDYPYFDGTQLINSLFSKVVVPIEYLKRYGGTDQAVDYYLHEHAQPQYRTCLQYLKNLSEKAPSPSKINPQDTDNVFRFFRHIRNALCHSGTGELQFYPYDNCEEQITHLVFRDYKFEACLHVEKELMPLVDLFDDIIFVILSE